MQMEEGKRKNLLYFWESDRKTTVSQPLGGKEGRIIEKGPPLRQKTCPRQDELGQLKFTLLVATNQGSKC